MWRLSINFECNHASFSIHLTFCLNPGIACVESIKIKSNHLLDQITALLHHRQHMQSWLQQNFQDSKLSRIWLYVMAISPLQYFLCHSCTRSKVRGRRLKEEEEEEEVGSGWAGGERGQKKEGAVDKVRREMKAESQFLSLRWHIQRDWCCVQEQREVAVVFLLAFLCLWFECTLGKTLIIPSRFLSSPAQLFCSASLFHANK